MFNEVLSPIIETVGDIIASAITTRLIQFKRSMSRKLLNLKKNKYYVQSTGDNPNPINTYPKLSDPNWVKIGHVKKLYMYPVKSGSGQRYRTFKCTQYGMIAEDSRGIFWDGMFLIYNTQTNTCLNFGIFGNWNALPLMLMTVKMKDEYEVQFYGVGMPNLYVYIDKRTNETHEIFYYQSWHGDTPVKFIDCGATAAAWINTYLETSNLRIVYRDCNPLIEQPNIIRENWMKFSMVYSNVSEENMEMFPDLTRCVLMTTDTQYQLRENTDNYLEILRFRPNILISVREPFGFPFMEKGWEWIKINNTIIRMIKPVPQYVITQDLMEDNDLHAIEDKTTHLGVYYAPYVPGDMHEKDYVFLYIPNDYAGFSSHT